MEKIIITQAGQSLFDLALIHYGHIGGALDIIKRNDLNGFTDNIAPGTHLKVSIHAEKNPMVTFLAKHPVGTMEPDLWATGIGWMAINKDFIIAPSA